MRRKHIHPKQRPTIFWDPSQNMYALKTDPSDAYVNDLKLVCNTAPRFSGDSKVWFVTEDDLSRAKATISAHFPTETYGSIDFIPKPDPNARIQSNGHLTGAGKAALTMFEVGGYDDARKVYSMLLNKYHPDKNLPTSSHEKSQAITLAWKEVKQHFGWS